jgi:hypothetical protein
MNHVPEGHPTKPTIATIDDPCILVVVVSLFGLWQFNDA